MLWVCLLLITAAANTHGFKCSTCKDIVKKFNEGLVKTAKSNFGGGNTHWEEKSLGSFAFSETRLIEIGENLCNSSVQECHTFLEKHEEDIENWWFKKYAKKKETDLHKFLCIEKSSSCCENGTYGPVCLPCTGGKEKPCRGNGKCNGDGTRTGTGKCSCDSGYKGDECENCADNYFEESRDATQTVCQACHQSCKDGCDGPNSKECYDCAAGWELDEEGCLDIDECAADEPPCKETEFCTNSEGSHICTACDKSCSTCTGAGADKCTACAALHYQDETDSKCKACHVSCSGSCTDATPATCDACKVGWTAGDNGCEDANECESGEADCDEDDSYCMNNQGSYKCSTCHSYCKGCTGAGSSKCKECKEGYKQDDTGACKDIDECEEVKSCSGEQEKCVNQQGSYRCDCVDGYVRKDDSCVPKPKDKTKEKKGKSRAYKGPGTCDTCKAIVENIKAGMEKTENTNFGGGNTRWEEQKLGKYIYSETRLIEILERVCGLDGVRDEKEQKVDVEQCYDMLEKYEETLEDWWFNLYAKGEDVDLEEWLCIDKMMICCYSGTYGAACKNCIGGRERPCYGNGECEGEGTRGGSGVCNCNKGYAGYECSECAPLNYTSSHNDTHIECKGCHSACLTACFDEGAQGCEDCATGWRFETEEGCVDVNECENESSPCDDDQYCHNTDGSFTCNECDEACNESCIGPGPANCNSCNALYYKDAHNVCKACHPACASSCTDDSPLSCDACKAGWNDEEELGCVDIDECSNGQASCSEDQYCKNIDGSYNCVKCPPECRGCTGSGAGNCKECATGFLLNPDTEKCQDVDECAQQDPDAEPLCPSAQGKVCVNTAPGYKCACPKDQEENKDGLCVPKKEKPKKKKKGNKNKNKNKAKKNKGTVPVTVESEKGTETIAAKIAESVKEEL